MLRSADREALIRDSSRDGNIEPDPGTGGIRFTIGVMVDSADEVDRLTEQMRAAGAGATREPVEQSSSADARPTSAIRKATISRSRGPTLRTIRSSSQPAEPPAPEPSTLSRTPARGKERRFRLPDQPVQPLTSASGTEQA